MNGYIKISIMPLFAILVFILYMSAIIFPAQIDCLIINHTLTKMPPNYRLVSNGKKFKFINDKEQLSTKSFKTKIQTVSDAWWNYNYDLKNKELQAERNPTNWHTYE